MSDIENIDIIYYDLCKKSADSGKGVVADSRGDSPIVCIIAHCIGVELENIINVFLDKSVSSHYLIPQITAEELKKIKPFDQFEFRFPKQIPAIRFVEDEKRAWHAGNSFFANFNKFPGCDQGLNSCSIGIEFHAPGYKEEPAYFVPYNSGQISTAKILIKELMRKYNIPSQNFLAHSTIAPSRKTDPGPLFFWKKLFESGIGYLPLHNEVDVQDIFDHNSFIKDTLQEIGFSTECELSDLVKSYIIQFAPHLWRDDQDYSLDSVITSLRNFDLRVFK